MMTPEQRKQITVLFHSSSATPRDMAVYVESLLAAERSAERERCVAIIDASCVINEAQAVALIDAIRAQGDGK